MENYREKNRVAIEGICLRRIDYGNTSQVASFLTPGEGRIDVMIKGAWRSPKKGIPTGVDLLGRYRLIYLPSRSGALGTLLDWTMIEHFGGLRLSAERAICGYYAVELMQNFTTYSQSCLELYVVFIDKLKQFAMGERLGMGVLELEAACLEHYGSCPDFSTCAGCRTDWRDISEAWFSASLCGVLCRKCVKRLEAEKKDVPTPLKLPVLNMLMHVCSEKNVENNGTASPQVIVAASKFLRFHISRLLRKKLSMWKYLQDRHYSNALTKARG